MLVPFCLASLRLGGNHHRHHHHHPHPHPHPTYSNHDNDDDQGGLPVQLGHVRPTKPWSWKLLQRLYSSQSGNLTIYYNKLNNLPIAL